MDSQAEKFNNLTQEQLNLLLEIMKDFKGNDFHELIQYIEQGDKERLYSDKMKELKELGNQWVLLCDAYKTSNDEAVLFKHRRMETFTRSFLEGSFLKQKREQFRFYQGLWIDKMYNFIKYTYVFGRSDYDNTFFSKEWMARNFQFIYNFDTAEFTFPIQAMNFKIELHSILNGKFDIKGTVEYPLNPSLWGGDKFFVKRGVQDPDILIRVLKNAVPVALNIFKEKATKTIKQNEEAVKQLIKRWQKPRGINEREAKKI